MRAKITKRAVDALEEGVLWDPELRGFGVRGRNGGGKYYVLKFRSGGKQRWHTIGRHGSPWTPEQARREATRILGELATGRAPADKTHVTVATAIDGFVEAHCRHCAQVIKPPGCCAGMWQIGGAAGKLHRLRTGT